MGFVIKTMRMDVFVYLSGPITPKNGYMMQQNIEATLPTFYQCLEEGFPAFLPHLCGLAVGCEGVDYRTWMNYDFAVIRRCTHVLMLDRWETSSGALEEKKFAEEIGIPVFYSFDSLLEALDAH